MSGLISIQEAINTVDSLMERPLLKSRVEQFGNCSFCNKEKELLQCSHNACRKYFCVDCINVVEVEDEPNCIALASLCFSCQIYFKVS